MSYAQRDTPILAKLCTLLVEDQYGELASRIFTVLARHGRQTLPSIVRASYLNSRQIKYGLIVLIQQHLVFHSSFLDPTTTYYEIDWQQAYSLVRYGKILKAVEDRFGGKAANVMSNLIALGHTRIQDLREAYFPPSDNNSDAGSDSGRVNGKVNGHKPNGTANGANGHNNGHSNGHGEGEEDVNDLTIQSEEELDAIIHHLMLEGWIIRVDEIQYLSPGDIQGMVQREVLGEQHDGKMPSGVKAKEQMVFEINSRKRAMRDDWCRVPKCNSRKRLASDPDFSRTTKRLKQGALEWQPRDANNIVMLESGLVIRTNPEKISVALRTEQLVHLVEQRLGPVTAKIYEVMLRLMETTIARAYEPYADPPPSDPDAMGPEVQDKHLVTAQDVAKKLDKDLDILDGLDPYHVVRLVEADTRVRYDTTNRQINPPVDPTTLSYQTRTKVIDCHIRRLADDPFHFTTWHSRAGFSQWHVEFDELSKSLIQHEIETTIQSRGGDRGPLGVKLIRALKKKGKLDERQTCNTMMMPAGEIRQIANEMAVQGFVQTQEIPKVERREAKHSIHLIWYDRQRAREKLLHDTYKGMIRILQRIAFEKEKVRELLNKAERSDVVGNEEKWLSQDELSVLRKWKEVQDKLLLQLLREDDLVATLRDHTGPLTSP
ncbi:hypothetical protein BU24DRAFT_441721 [Aaosphaeria arxii CBS 175.79]|uniref:DNA-directed RNA polymerase III subunit RPC3 n=1 Tax=Aaosphaeria arxii CBS 175.79 TaxID=1450172 RepID=A0A6A5XU63_9PLEO|nr:uncharacterized protein BU24DRAFT_441721 [Aaosphaeria arxii CBS 175.79]KAF2016742.1 hypothetical protein BU24DRAFT_441721 [Aaosphaeria arxii CBS 175.79]